jgi:hypothetical protein
MYLHYEILLAVIKVFTWRKYAIESLKELKKF